MSRSFIGAGLRAAVAAAILFPSLAGAQGVNPALFSGLHWRFIGPYRAGRVTSVAGAASRPNLYYIGTPGGGVFQTTDGGVVWRAVFDAPGADSIGAVALAPSDPRVVYAGTGEQLPGNGIWGSRDGGRHWRRLGLTEARLIDALIVSPTDPNWVVAASGPGDAAGGIWLTRDGGASWQRTLAPGGTTGAVNLAADPNDGKDLYAATQAAGAGLFGRRGGVAAAPGEIYRSRDGGASWAAVPAAGLPLRGRGKMGLAVAPGMRGERVYAYLGRGLYRSDDGGARFRRITRDPRITGGGYFCQVYADPNHANVIYAMETTLYRSTDGGVTFHAFKGAPGGDDYHVLWIDPANSRRMLLGADQGATVTVDGGRTWGLWFNQPTAQLYRVSVDHRFPFHMYTSQQDSGGTLALPDRSDYGRISMQDWYSTGGNENAFSAPDPLHRNFVYVNNWYGNVVRFDRRDGQLTTVFFAGAHYRLASPAPLVFSPTDAHRLYLGTQYLLASDDGGRSWRQLGGDLTGGRMRRPAGARGRFFRGPAIAAIAPSPVTGAVVWTGTNNGRVLVSRDGGAHWQLALQVRGAVRNLAASPRSAGAACAVLTSAPQIECTSDYGAHWRAAIGGLPADPAVWAVRIDPRQPGLFYAALNRGVYVSFDGGAQWQSLRLNFPAAPVRDLAVAGDDLAAATYGRGMWVLDDLTTLRHISAAAAAAARDAAYFYPPAVTVRVRNDNDQDMPLPAEVPAANNPPAGATFDYYLPRAAAQAIELRLYAPSGALVRSFSSAPPPPRRVLFNVAPDWFAPPAKLPNHAGDNRFSWNLRAADPRVIWPRGFRSFEVGDDATPGRTPRQEPEGYLLPPGIYQARLTIGGHSYTRRLRVVMDPRSTASAASVVRQAALEAAVNAALSASYAGYHAAAAAHDAAAQRRFAALNREFVSYFSAIGSGDGMPNAEVAGVWPGECRGLRQAAAAWHSAHPSTAVLAAPGCRLGAHAPPGTR
jgi:photosystem II stability/assembly factor-like uncharacterized protein